jgi:hypothetical protein
MPEEVLGLPLHPLLVHLPVVLLPLAALGLVALAVVSRWRAGYSGLVLLLTVLAVASVPPAKLSGDNLGEIIETPKVEKHEELGEVLLAFAAPLLLPALAFWWLGRRQRADRPVPRALSLLVVLVALVLATAATVHVVRVGHSGADAAWGNVLGS